jgi:hypothetical protein
MSQESNQIGKLDWITVGLYALFVLLGWMSIYSAVYNPEAPLWIFDETWVPVPVFRDISRPNVADVEIWFYNPQKQYHSKTVPSEISSYYPNLPHSAYEHPRELSAYMLSEPEKYEDSKGFKDLIETIGVISINN